MKQLTEQQAIEFAKSEVWKIWTDEQMAFFQLQQRRLCMPFDRYRQAVEAILKRPVWTHEFAKPELLIDEYQREKPAPTMEEIINMIPPEKLILLVEEE